MINELNGFSERPDIQSAALILILVIQLFTPTSAWSSECDPSLVQLHNQYFDKYEPLLMQDSTSGNSDVYYYSSLALHGLVSGLECTHDEARLQKLLTLVDNMIAAATDRNGDGYLEWMNYYYNPSPFGEDQLGTWQAMAAMARVAAFIMRTPEFADKYRGRAMSYVDYIRTDIIDYWYNGVYGGDIPYVEWGYPNANPPIWSDKATHFLTINLFLYEATGDPFYRDIAIRGGNAFKKRLQPSGEGWVWDNDGALLGADGNNEGVPDTSHSNREAMWVVFMHEAGLVFSDEDVVRMAATLSDVIWNGSTESPRFSNYINGSNALYRSNLAWENGHVESGWSLLGRYRNSAQTALLAEMTNTLKGTSDPNYDADRILSMVGNLARNTMGASPPVVTPGADAEAPTVVITSPVDAAQIPRRSQITTTVQAFDSARVD